MANDWISTLFEQAQGPQAPDPTGFGVDPAALGGSATSSDPLAALSGMGLFAPGELESLSGLPAGSAPGQPIDLPSALQDTAMAVTGRRGATGSVFNGVLPAWAKDLSPEVLADAGFDPYLGIASTNAAGDIVYAGARTYMGDHKSTEITSFAGHMGRPESPTSADLPDNLPPEAKVQHDDKTLTATQVKNLPYSWDEEKITGVMKQMRKSGINVTSFDQLTQTWGSLVDRASLMYSLSEGKNKVTPWDVLDMYKSEAKAAGSLVDYESGTRTSTSRSVAHVTEGEAWSSLQQTLSQMLGHDPSDQEVRDFTYRMNQLAAANPSISKTIAKYKAGDVTSSSTTTEGGFSGADVAQAAYQKAQSDPDYAEFQSATTYYNAALSAMGAIGNV